jgi:hypothetical protein
MRLKQIDLTNGALPPDPDYIYFIDEDDPMGDIISMKKPQGARHSDLINKNPKVFKINIKKRGKI